MHLRNKCNSQRPVVFPFPYPDRLFPGCKLEPKWGAFYGFISFYYQFSLIDLYVIQVSCCLTVKNSCVRLRNSVMTGFAHLSVWLYLSWCSLKSRGGCKMAECSCRHGGASPSPKASTAVFPRKPCGLSERGCHWAVLELLFVIRSIKR